MKPSFAHCLFEQSGTFKRAFRQLNIPAKDYDIQNQFGETDVVCDLFRQIDDEWVGCDSIFRQMSESGVCTQFYLRFYS